MESWRGVFAFLYVPRELVQLGAVLRDLYMPLYDDESVISYHWGDRMVRTLRVIAGVNVSVESRFL